MTYKYYISTGEADKKRLAILNKIYNPITFNFLTESGLKSGMNVMELGCGFGQSAIWMAQQVAPLGTVYAIDLNEDTLKIARENAKQAQVHNIEFINLDGTNIKSLNKQFDFFYGRWVIEFCESPLTVLQDIYNLLKPGGIFTYETLNFIENGSFSFKLHSAIERWHNLGIAMARVNKVELNMAHRIYHDLKNIGYKDLYARKHQPILITPEQKSVYSLGLISIKDNVLKHNLMTENEINNFIEEFHLIENNEDIIIGFFNNILITGIK